MPSDEALISRIRSGDSTAAEALVSMYYDDCWRFAYRMTGHRADAEDAVQETFLRAFRALDRYEERQMFRSWLFRILTNRCRTILLRGQRRHRLVGAYYSETLAVNENSSEMEIDPSSIDDSTNRLADSLQDALNILDGNSREAFLLKHAEGMEYAQMSAITGVSISALKMRVKRAREAMQPLLMECRND